MSLKISEIFFSIQGEGAFIGYPTLFIRLYGCNLNCQWCDTPYAKEGGNFYEKTCDEIVKFWKENYPDIPYITLTGGEPLLQEKSIDLMKSLLKMGAVVNLETNGSIPLDRVPREVFIVMDVKTPSSGMVNFNNYENFKYLQKKDVIKFVIQDERDFEWSINLIHEFNLWSKVCCLFSPVYGAIPPKDLAKLILKIKKPIRFQVQLHKLLSLK